MMREKAVAEPFEVWLDEVKAVLTSINMPIDQWQTAWAFDFSEEFSAGTSPKEAAMKANRFWWYQQNKAIDQDCKKTLGCWLPREHDGECKTL